MGPLDVVWLPVVSAAELTFDRDGRSVTIDQFAMRFIGLRQP